VQNVTSPFPVQEVFERVKYSPLVALQKARNTVREDMEAGLRACKSGPAPVSRTTALRGKMRPLGGSNTSLRGMLKMRSTPRAHNKEASPPRNGSPDSATKDGVADAKA